MVNGLAAYGREWLRTSEVAELLGITPATVRSRLYMRGVEPLRVHDRLLLVNAKDVHRLNGDGRSEHER